MIKMFTLNVLDWVVYNNHLHFSDGTINKNGFDINELQIVLKYFNEFLSNYNKSKLSDDYNFLSKPFAIFIDNNRVSFYFHETKHCICFDINEREKINNFVEEMILRVECIIEYLEGD